MGGEHTYGFIGGGNMAEALIKGLLRSGRAKPQNIHAYDVLPARLNHLRQTFGIAISEGNRALLRESVTLVLAVKPQYVDQVLEDIAPEVSADHLLISIAAGVTLRHIQGALPAPVPVVRVMPNTPALVLAGASALTPGRHVRPDHVLRARSIFEAVGLVVQVEEKHMDVVTGLSGSGPAYVFVLLEALTDAGVAQGLPRDIARLLANQTVLGSARLALETGTHPAQLKDMVTSPGGTTSAGLSVLERNGFRGLLIDAVAAATRRSAELDAER